MQNKPLPPDPRANACRDRHGQYFRSQVDCAHANGVTVQTLCYHMRTHGNLDRMGVGRGGRDNKGKSKPVRIDGRTWASQLQLAIYLGVSALKVSRWIRANDMERLRAEIYRADMQNGTIYRRRA